MKKLLSLMLALVMVLSMTTAVFADGEACTLTDGCTGTYTNGVCGECGLEIPTDYSITVSNTESTISINGQEYVAYKLFDMTHAAPTTVEFPDDSAVAYTVSRGFEDFSYTVDGTTYNASDHVSLETDNLVEYLEGLDDDADAVNDFAKAVWNFIEKYPNKDYYKRTATGTDEEKAVFNNLAAGYYLVYGVATANDNSNDTTSGDPDVVAACILTNTNPNATANVKAEVPTINKVIANYDQGEGENERGAAYYVGSEVQFKLTSNVPDITGYDEYSYIISDTMTSGLDFVYDATALTGVTVKIGEDTLTNGPHYTVALGTETGDPTFTITLKDLVKLIKEDNLIATGETIEVTYSATLNKNALNTDVEKNTVNLTYSNDPYTKESKAKTPDSEVYVYDFDIDIYKYAYNENEKTNTSAMLANAKFVLKNTAGKFYYVDPNTKAVSWKDTQDEATVVTTGDDGKGYFTGLDEGVYTLVETEAPAGYNKLLNDITVTINASYATNGTIDLTNAANILNKDTTNSTGQYYVLENIPNTTGKMLPTTGGIGTVIFYLIGGVLVLGSVVLLVTKKRMSAESK